MDGSDAVRSLSGLAHSGRLDIFRLLVKAGPQGVAAGQIACSLGVAPNTLSANLKVLRHAGLIAPRRTGRSIHYAADFGAMRALLGFLMEDCCDGNAAICAPLAAVATRALCAAPDLNPPLEAAP